MARPTYVNITDARVNVDSALDEDLLSDLRDNAEAARIVVFSTDLGESTTTSTSFVTVATFYLFIPDLVDYTGIQRTLTVHVDVKVSAGTGTYRLRDDGSGNVSSEFSTTSTSYETKSQTLNLTASWKGTTRTIQLQAKEPAGNTAYIKADDRATWRMEY